MLRQSRALHACRSFIPSGTYEMLDSSRPGENRESLFPAEPKVLRVIDQMVLPFEQQNS